MPKLNWVHVDVLIGTRMIFVTTGDGLNLSPMTGPRLVSTNLAEDNEVIVKVSTTFNFNMV